MLLDTFKEYLDLLWGTSQNDVLKYIAFLLTIFTIVYIFRRGAKR
jgi:hypothetical protein